MTLLLGGAFDPPHNGHVALARKAGEEFGPSLVILVNAAPGHKDVVAGGEERLELARAAFPEYDVDLDPYARTIDLLEARSFEDPLFVVGADEFAHFLETWKRPEDVLELTRLAVAARPGFERAALDGVLARLRHPERVQFFELEPFPISSSDVRARVARGVPIDDLVPPAVAETIWRLGLYR